jgi:hypothetical protein
MIPKQAEDAAKKAAKEAMAIVARTWDKLPSILKYSYATCAIMLIAIWIIKPGDNSVWGELLGTVITSKRICFGIIVLFGVVVPLLNHGYVRSKILIYKQLYPIEKFGKNLCFAKLGDAIFIIDREQKEIRWIENARTAVDLGYYPYAWTEAIPINDPAQSTPQGTDTINLKDYKRKAGIRTQGIPGT